MCKRGVYVYVCIFLCVLDVSMSLSVFLSVYAICADQFYARRNNVGSSVKDSEPRKSPLACIGKLWGIFFVDD